LGQGFEFRLWVKVLIISFGLKFGLGFDFKVWVRVLILRFGLRFLF
jgi:hypothetical protein